MGFKVIDNFLTNYDSLREHCDSVVYDGETNPADGVFYPGVTLNIPNEIKKEVILNLSALMGRDVVIKAMFMRLSDKSTTAPHQAHNDALMGDYSLMLYLNRLVDCEGGTSLVFHKSSLMDETPLNDKQLKIWKRDANISDAWQIREYCKMMPNRAFVFNANEMHRAEPIGGFGDNPKNARLVLTTFYD